MENDDDARAGAGEGACVRVLKWGPGLPTVDELKPLPHPLIPPGRAGAGLGACGCGPVLEWEQGLPTAEELTPLSHPLIPPALAAAFLLDATGNAFLSSAYDCPVFAHDSSPTSHLAFRCDDEDDEEDGEAEEEEEEEIEDATSGIGGPCQGGTGRAGKKAKKARMVWTPELHHRFVEAVAHLGDKGAVPKAIVRIMNVDGLTRENVASHLQKYRMYLKRTRSPAKPQQPPAFPPEYGAHFRPQQPSDIAFSRTDYGAFSSRDSEKLERDKAAVGWKRTKQEF